METITKTIKWTGLFLLTFLLLSCEQPTNTNLDPKDEPNNTPQPYRSTQEDREIYEALLGKWKTAKYDPNKTPSLFIDPDGVTIEFKSNSVVIDDTPYSINIETDIFRGGEKPGIDYSIHRVINAYFNIQIDKNEGKYINFDYDKNEIYRAKQSINDDYIETLDLYCIYSRIINNEYNCDLYVDNSYFIYIGPSDDSNSENPINPSEIIGTYRFTTAGAGQINGSITLNEDNSWDFTGKNSAITDRTYSINGNKITFYWTSSGYTIEETFTVTTNGSESVWDNNSNYSNLLITLFTYSKDGKITFTKE